MRRQDQRAIGAHLQPLEHGHTVCNQRIGLLDQRFERDDHAVADEATHAVAQDPRRNEVQHGFPAADDQRMPGIVSALESHDGRRAVGQKIHDLAFAFVTPLRADDDDVLTHSGVPVCGSSGG
jgi:hypothetical protein